MTIAEQAAKAAGNDGQAWYVDTATGQAIHNPGPGIIPGARPVDSVWRDMGAKVTGPNRDTLYTFPDGSAILATDGAWDIALPCGRCFAGGGHTSVCEAQTAAEDADPADLIRVEEVGPCGPRVFVPDGVDAETVLERLPYGWTVADDDWNNGVPNDDMDGHWHPMSEIEYCACGCGEEADTTVRMLPESDRDTASALGWAELSIAPMRQPVRVVEGHEDDVPDYIARDDEGETDDD